MSDWTRMSVPLAPREVQEFLNSERGLFEKTLSSVREQISNSIQHLGVYKVYGREDKQSGAVLKDARKVRLKFDTHFESKGESFGSLWSLPDIIGFTIVVAYPSDISAVCTIVDKLIDAKKLINAGADDCNVSESNKRASLQISTKHGRPLTEKGYFACHYNLRLPGPGGTLRLDRPICEVQIKTVMHDAWGAKTHDLTYKPTGRTAQELIDSFNVLGDTLALIDRQSDLIRHSIERNARVREAKRRRLQKSVLTDAVMGLLPETDEMFAVLKDVVEFDLHPLEDENLMRRGQIVEAFFSTKPQPCCAGLCLLALRSNSKAIRQQALDALDVWLRDTSDPPQRVAVQMLTGLAAYCFDDPTAAIEATESAIEIISAAALSWPDPKMVNIYANLAYYHAVRVGSHEGTLGGSASKALQALKNVGKHVSAAYPQRGIDAPLNDIVVALKNKKEGSSVFSILDTAAFVRIQTTDSESELATVITKLREIHRLIEEKNLGKSWPFSQKTLKLMIEYNDYCARTRLAELEVGN